MVAAIRYDRGEVTKVSRSDEGFLTVKGVATRTGVFPYRNSDGSTRYELRHPDDVFDPASLQTLAGKPATLEHPQGLVSQETAGADSIGSVNNRVHVVGDGLIEVVFNVHRKDGVSAIESGKKRQLSCGYRCDVEEEEGIYEGEAYGHRQRNIRYNHLAVVGKARAGEVASMHYDSADGDDIGVQMEVCKRDSSNVNTEAKTFQRKHMASIRIDGVDYSDVPEVVAAVMAQKIKRLDSLEQDVTANAQARLDAAEQVSEFNAQLGDLTGERDRAEGRADGLEQELEDVRFELEELKLAQGGTEGEDALEVDEEAIEARVQEAVKGRVDAMEDARLLLSKLGSEEIKLDASMSPLDVQKAVVVGLNPGVEIADDEVKGYYKALRSDSVRTDSASGYHADMLDSAVFAAKQFTGKKKPDKEAAAKKRMDNCKTPLAMSKRAATT